MPPRLARNLRWPDPTQPPHRSHSTTHDYHQSLNNPILSSPAAPTLTRPFNSHSHSSSTSHPILEPCSASHSLHGRSSNPPRSAQPSCSSNPINTSSHIGHPPLDQTSRSQLADGLERDLTTRLRLSPDPPSIPATKPVQRRREPTSSWRSLHTSNLTGQDAGLSTVSPPSTWQRRSKRRALREQALRASLPAFELHDSRFSPQTVELCPSSQHPISALGTLIEAVCADGLRVPGDTAEPPHVAVAFDMEWVISRVRGHENRTALVQLAGQRRTLLIQLSSFGGWTRDGVMPPSLLDFLLDQRVIKLGVGIRNDGLKLLRDHRCGPKPYLNNYLELSLLVKALDRKKYEEDVHRLLSLQQIVADYLEVYLPKTDVRTSDWSKPLNERQLDYAASDVVATIKVCRRLFGLLGEHQESGQTQTSIFKLLDSLQPFELAKDRVKPTAVAVAANLDPWLGIQSDPTSVAVKPGPPADLKSRSIVPKFTLTPRTMEAWELWHGQEQSVETCAKQMGIKPISVAIYVSKVMLMNKINQDDDQARSKVKKEQENRRMFELVIKYRLCERMNVKLNDFGF